MAAVLAALMLVSGCGVVTGWVEGKVRVGRLLTSWSQADYRDIGRIAPEGSVVVATEEQRAEWLDRLPEELDGTGMAEADLRESFLVLGSYGKCMEESRVWMDRRRTAVWLEDYVPRADRGTLCGWSPLTIDVWQVPRSALRDTPAGELGTREPN